MLALLLWLSINPTVEVRNGHIEWNGGRKVWFYGGPMPAPEN